MPSFNQQVSREKAGAQGVRARVTTPGARGSACLVVAFASSEQQQNLMRCEEPPVLLTLVSAPRRQQLVASLASRRVLSPSPHRHAPSLDAGPGAYSDGINAARAKEDAHTAVNFDKQQLSKAERFFSQRFGASLSRQLQLTACSPYMPRSPHTCDAVVRARYSGANKTPMSLAPSFSL